MDSENQGTELPSTDDIKPVRRKYWDDERNAERRQRYATDPEYRRRAIESTRRNYRRKNPNMRDDDCRANIAQLSAIGRVRTVELAPGRSVPLLCLTKDELATALGRNLTVVYRWLRDGRWPKARFVSARMRIDVYTESEARALLAVFGKHQRTTAYLRHEHKDTVQQLARAVERARVELLAAHGLAPRGEERAPAEGMVAMAGAQRLRDNFGSGHAGATRSLRV